MKNTHGGKREGAGLRKNPIPEHLKQEPFNTRLPQWIKNKIKKYNQAEITRKAIISYLDLEEPENNLKKEK